MNYTFQLDQVELRPIFELPLPSVATKGGDSKQSFELTFASTSPARFTLEFAYPDETQSPGIMPFLALLVVDPANHRAAFLPTTHRGLNDAPAGRLRQVYTATLPDWAVHHASLKLHLYQLRRRGVMFLRGTAR